MMASIFSTPKMGYYLRLADVNRITSFPPAPVGSGTVHSVSPWKMGAHLRLGDIHTKSC